MRFRVCFLLVLLLIITGCLNKEPRPDENVSWQEEILLAHDCGMDGLRCCVDREPPCFYEQVCCVDPNNPKRNYCADKCTYGGEKEFCRVEEPTCDIGLVCHQYYCVKCGEENQPCCGSGKCNNDLICYQGECVECGLVSNPCCSDGLACLNQGKTDNTRTECQNNICLLCGADGYKACFGEPKCNQAHLLNNNICYQCGNFNQPCCNDESGVDYKCNPKMGLKCELGFCSK